MLEIPYDRLNPDVLNAIVESYVLRDGTDYGSRELSLDEKCVAVKAQLLSGAVVLVFDEDSQSCNLLSRKDFNALASKS